MKAKQVQKHSRGRFVPYLILAGLWVFHFDLWNWEAVHPIYLGVFPTGLFYHVVYCLLALAIMPLFYRAVWPPDPPR